MSEKNKSMKILKCFKMCLMVVFWILIYSILLVVYCKKCLQFFDFDNKEFVMWFLLYDENMWLIVKVFYFYINFNFDEYNNYFFLIVE